MSITSCVIAPATGGRCPAAAISIPIMLSAIPPTALWRPIARIRRPIWMSSSTLANAVSSTTASAASAVMSLFCPKATLTVVGLHGRCIVDSVAQKQGRSLLSLLADNLHFFFWTLAKENLTNAHFPSQVTNFRLPIAGNEHDLVHPGAWVLGGRRRSGFLALACRGTERSPRTCHQSEGCIPCRLRWEAVVKPPIPVAPKWIFSR